MAGPPLVPEPGFVPPPPPKGDRILPRIATCVAVTLALALLGFGIGSVLHDNGPQFPAEWDARVQPFIDFVEKTRGLEFKHPVAVYFLSPEQYRRAALGGDGGAPSTDPEKEAQSTGIGRAFGLIEGELDLKKAGETLADSGTLAYYSSDAKIVNVKGTELTVGLRVTLVHELTHALQDQYFDLNARFARGDSEQNLVLRSVVEGDAVTIENRYVEQLSDTDKRRYDEESSAGRDAAMADLGKVPTALVALQAIPYAIGRPYVGMVEATGGTANDTKALDDLMRNLPDDTSRLFTPGDDAERRKVEPPKLGTGEPLQSDSVGAYGLYIQLAERIDPLVAIDAVDGWRGDAFVAAQDAPSPGAEEKICVAANFEMATEKDGKELRDSLELWKAAMPAEAAITIGGEAATATMRSCDPGTATKSDDRSSLEALGYPGGRLDIATALLLDGDDPSVANCIADQAVRKLTIEELQADELSGARQTEIAGLLKDLRADC